MKRLIISLVVLAVLIVMAIPIYSKGKGGSNLKVIDANGLTLGKVVGAGVFGEEAQVVTTIGGEFVILLVDRDGISPVHIPRFKVVNCAGQAFIDPAPGNLIIIGVGGVDNSVYKVLDRDPALLEDFTVKSFLRSGGCDNVSFFTTDMFPATHLGDLSELTPPFEYSAE